MAIQPTQPQGIGGVIDTAFQLYKSSFAVTWPIALLTSVLGLAPFAYLIYLGLPVFDPTAGVAADPSMVGKVMIAVVISIIPSTWGFGALYLKQRAVGTDQELSTGAAFQAALSRLPALIGAIILYFLAIMVGFIALLVPGFILMLSLLLNMLLVVFENKGPFDSLAASHKLVWGNWWRSATMLSVVGILMLVIYIAIGLVFSLATPFAGMAVGDALLATMVIQLVSQAVINVIVTPFTTASLIALYWDLKLRKEGGDLAARVNALSAA
jgi:hypothetical protein